MLNYELSYKMIELDIEEVFALIEAELWLKIVLVIKNIPNYLRVFLFIKSILIIKGYEYLAPPCCYTALQLSSLSYH